MSKAFAIHPTSGIFLIHLYVDSFRATGIAADCDALSLSFSPASSIRLSTGDLLFGQPTILSSSPIEIRIEMEFCIPCIQLTII